MYDPDIIFASLKLELGKHLTGSSYLNHLY
jgi:hypothetical protein